jgi:uncharacterized OB-fold protein
MSATAPAFSANSQYFWDGVEQGELRLPWCGACGRPYFPPRPFCPFCWDDAIEWRQAAGTGTLYTFTVVKANPPSAFVPELPYAIGIVRLDEGVQMMCHLHGDLDALVCEAPVRAGFAELNGRRVPSFAVVGTPPS